MTKNSSTTKLSHWFESKLGSGWKASLGSIAFLAVIGVVSTGYIAIPKIKYSNASTSEKCQIDLKKLHNNDKFCDTDNKIQSLKAVAESERRARLTSKQRCEEDHKNFSDPDTGEAYFITCKDDGTYDVKSSDELASQSQSDLSDYYSSLQQDAEDNSSPTGCTPLSNAGKCYSPGQYCRNSDHGSIGVSGNGSRIVCTDNNGWRWEPN